MFGVSLWKMHLPMEWSMDAIYLHHPSSGPGMPIPGLVCLYLYHYQPHEHWWNWRMSTLAFFRVGEGRMGVGGSHYILGVVNNGIQIVMTSHCHTLPLFWIFSMFVHELVIWPYNLPIIYDSLKTTCSRSFVFCHLVWIWLITLRTFPSWRKRLPLPVPTSWPWGELS